MDAKRLQRCSVLTKRQRHGQIEKGRKSLERRIRSKFLRWCLPQSCIHHGVDGEIAVVLEQGADRAVYGVCTGRSSVFIARKPTKNYVVACLVLSVRGEVLHGIRILDHTAARTLVLFDLTVRLSGRQHPFDSSRGADTTSQRQRSTAGSASDL